MATNNRTRTNRVDIAAGLSYHITLCSRLKLYARAMVDAGLIGEHTTDHESGEEASSTFNKMDTKMGILATAGLRWVLPQQGRNLGRGAAMTRATCRQDCHSSFDSELSYISGVF